MVRTLIVYSTVDGHTLTISRRIAGHIRQQGGEVTLLPVEEAFGVDCAAFDAIVIGAGIRYGRHRPLVYRFIAERLQCLERIPSAFFSVSAVARKQSRATPAGNPYFRTMCAKTGWTPALAATFAGRIDYARYKVLDRLAIRLIMYITRGPTDTRAAFDFTDWDQVDSFARQIVKKGPEEISV